jgi:lipopolysaccharide transport system permease protein
LKIYTPDSPLKNPIIFYKSIIKDLWSSRHLAWRLFTRDLKAQYRQSFLGYIWAFAPALFSMCTFLYLEHTKIITVSTTVPYIQFVLIGTILWQTFVDAILVPIKVVSNCKNLLSKLNFPRESLILAALGEITFNTILRLGLLLVLAPFIGLTLTLYTPLILIALFGLSLLGLSISLVLLPMALLSGDISKGLPLFLSAMYLMTPVAYPAATSGVGFWVSKLNPVVPLLRDGRNWTFGDLHVSMGSVAMIPILCILLFIGWGLYRIALPHITGRLGA